MTALEEKQTDFINLKRAIFSKKFTPDQIRSLMNQYYNRYLKVGDKVAQYTSIFDGKLPLDSLHK